MAALHTLTVDGKALVRILAVCSVTLALGVTAHLQSSGAAQPSQCRIDGARVTLPDLREASGIAPGPVADRLWALNDSGKPTLFALDAHGAVTRRVQLAGATVDDWEAVASGRCPSGSCLYIGDIGDNNGSRAQVAVYRVSEPSPAAATVPADAFTARYPDGAHDAETLLVAPDGRLYIVTKGSAGAVAIYRFPRELRAGTTMELERVGNPRDRGKVSKEEWITDGAVSRDGARVVLRTLRALYVYPTAQFLQGQWPEPRRITLAEFDEPQGEGVALGAGDSVYLIGEGGGKGRPGVFMRLTCPSDS
jgi:hypothetical protein